MPWEGVMTAVKPGVGMTAFLHLEAPQGEAPVAQWLLTFTDLVALLVCFFVLMFSMKELDAKAWDKIKGSMEGVFTVIPSEQVQAPQDAPQAETFVARRGSVLPYLQQVLRQKLAGSEAWRGWEGRYDRQRDEIWYAWPEGRDVGILASVLMTWRNEVAMVVGQPGKLDDALAVADALRARGARVVQDVSLEPGLADGVWMVVKGNQ